MGQELDLGTQNIDLVETRAAIHGDLQKNVTGVTTMGGCSMGPNKDDWHGLGQQTNKHNHEGL